MFLFPCLIIKFTTYLFWPIKYANINKRNNHANQNVARDITEQDIAFYRVPVGVDRNWIYCTRRVVERDVRKISGSLATGQRGHEGVRFNRVVAVQLFRLIPVVTGWRGSATGSGIVTVTGSIVFDGHVNCPFPVG